jgi:hypothetical protein
MRVIPIAVLLAAACVPLGATTYLPASFNEIVAESATIVYGRVAAVRGEWSPDRRTIDSVVTVRASAYLKGARGETLLLRVPGGQVGDRIMVMPGAPAFREGDLVVVFLKGTGPAIPSPVGLAQGVFRVAADPRSGQAMVVPSPVTARGPARTVRRGDPLRGPVPLDAFAAEVQALVEGGR